MDATGALVAAPLEPAPARAIFRLPDWVYRALAAPVLARPETPAFAPAWWVPPTQAWSSSD